jgi:hypothetical protein
LYLDRIALRQQIRTTEQHTSHMSLFIRHQKNADTGSALAQEKC